MFRIVDASCFGGLQRSNFIQKRKPDPQTESKLVLCRSIDASEGVFLRSNSRRG